MPKLRNAPITKDDIEEYLATYSDFSFEVSVLRKLTALGFSCKHSGTYEDPITKKTREFDIRAEKELLDFQGLTLNISLSVECKNLRNNFPLIIHCLPREEHECYLDLIWSSEPDSYIPPYEQAIPVRLNSYDCPYDKRMAVGKSSDQVGRKSNNNSELVGNDGDVFDKISQAINSAYDLIKKAHYASDKKNEVVTLVIPVLVVPNDRIWSVCYKQTGEIEREPTIESNLEYFIGKSWVIGNPSVEHQRRYHLSHLEIVQIDNINEMVNKYACMASIASVADLNTRKLRVLEESAR